MSTTDSILNDSMNSALKYVSEVIKLNWVREVSINNMDDHFQVRVIKKEGVEDSDNIRSHTVNCIGTIIYNSIM